MSNTIQAGNHYLGTGEVYFDRFDATTGLATGERFLGNVDGLQLAVTVDSVKKYSSATPSRELVAEAPIRTNAEISAICDEHMKENLALFARATEGLFTQGSGSYTSGAPNTIVAKIDRWVPTTKRAASAVVVKDSAQTTTYVLGIDYLFDLVLGRIFTITGGAITADQSLKLEYAYAAVSQAQVAIGQAPQIKGKLRFVGTNTQGPRFNAEFWIVQIGGDGQLDLLGEDFGKFTLKATVLADTSGHPSSTLGVIQQIA